MNMATLVLQVLLGLVFLPLSFLALRQHETDWYGTFLVASGPFASSAMVLASQKLRERILFRPETHCVLVLRTHPDGSVVLILRDSTDVALPQRKSFHCSGSSIGIKREVVIALSRCASGSFSSTLFSMASWAGERILFRPETHSSGRISSNVS